MTFGGVGMGPFGSINSDIPKRILFQFGALYFAKVAIEINNSLFLMTFLKFEVFCFISMSIIISRVVCGIA